MGPIAGIVVTLVLLALFIAMLIFVSQRSKRTAKDRRQAFGVAAAARGWAFETEAGGLSGTFASKPFHKGAKRHPHALDVMSGRLDGHPAVAFHYRYTLRPDPDTLADNYAWYTICAVQLPPGPPRVSLTVDRRSPIVRPVLRRGLTWAIDGNWLTCWESGTRASPDEAFARLEALVAIIDGRAGQIH
jgi:hypothetical protein